MVYDPRGVLAAGALIHADPDTDPTLGRLWAEQLLATGVSVPVLTRVRLATVDLKALARTHPSALRLATDADQLLAVLPATRQITQEHATTALSHIACDDRVRAHVAPRLAQWRAYARPVGAESAARSWLKGGVSLTMPHIAASKVEGLAWALTRREPDPLTPALTLGGIDPRLRKMLEYGDTLALLPQLGIRSGSVDWPPANEHRAPWLAAALLAGVLTTPTPARRQALIKALRQSTNGKDHTHRALLVELAEASDPDVAVLGQRYGAETVPASNALTAWALAWGHCAARAALDRLDQDVTSWRTLFGLLPGWHSSLGELLGVVTGVTETAGR